MIAEEPETKKILTLQTTVKFEGKINERAKSRIGEGEKERENRKRIKGIFFKFKRIV